MGLDSNACRLLLHAKRQGANFDRTLTLGRLNLGLTRAMMAKVLDEFGFYRDEAQIERIYTDSKGFVETFLTEIGADGAESLDATTYEGATHVHDLNTELPASFNGQYDAVIDGGTLEHVFNFPVALKSAMQAVKPGGRLFIITQCNNAMGHGFYQFSPELYYRVFSPENGFRVDDMFISEGSFGQVPWHSVSDPAVIRRRVELV
ncbi:MAG: class I SAM-dependent methyltransferase [Verrucomicrobiaceae bacterium]|nr:MAG: class I SAM-dependent methyltransferase [Verrucomicrobiaceae bacterium]